MTSPNLVVSFWYLLEKIPFNIIIVIFYVKILYSSNLLKPRNNPKHHLRKSRKWQTKRWKNKGRSSSRGRISVYFKCLIREKMWSKEKESGLCVLAVEALLLQRIRTERIKRERSEREIERTQVKSGRSSYQILIFLYKEQTSIFIP